MTAKPLADEINDRLWSDGGIDAGHPAIGQWAEWNRAVLARTGPEPEPAKQQPEAGS